MLLMDQDRSKGGGGRPQKHAGEPDKQGRTGTPVSLRLDPTLVAMIPSFIDLFRRQHDVRLSKTDVVEKGLAMLFRAYGLLPPAAAEQPSPTGQGEVGSS